MRIFGEREHSSVACMTGRLRAGVSASAAQPGSPRALAAAGRWQDALRAADARAGAPDWLLAAAARALLAGPAAAPDAEQGSRGGPSPGPASEADAGVEPGPGRELRDAAENSGAGARALAPDSSGAGAAERPGDAAPSTPARGPPQAPGPAAGSPADAGPGPGAEPWQAARPQGSGGEAADAPARPPASAARRGRRLAWECCMRVRDKRLAADLVLECLGAGTLRMQQGAHAKCRTWPARRIMR